MSLPERRKLGPRDYINLGIWIITVVVMLILWYGRVDQHLVNKNVHFSDATEKAQVLSTVDRLKELEKEYVHRREFEEMQKRLGKIEKKLDDILFFLMKERGKSDRN